VVQRLASYTVFSWGFRRSVASAKELRVQITMGNTDVRVVGAVASIRAGLSRNKYLVSFPT